MNKKKKPKPQQKMKPLEEDPCSTCLYGKARNQHNVAERVEKFNKVTPKEAFGASSVKQAKRAPPKPSKKARGKEVKKGKK